MNISIQNLRKKYTFDWKCTFLYLTIRTCKRTCENVPERVHSFHGLKDWRNKFSDVKYCSSIRVKMKHLEKLNMKSELTREVFIALLCIIYKGLLFDFANIIILPYYLNAYFHPQILQVRTKLLLFILVGKEKCPAYKKYFTQLKLLSKQEKFVLIFSRFIVAHKSLRANFGCMLSRYRYIKLNWKVWFGTGFETAQHTQSNGYLNCTATGAIVHCLNMEAHKWRANSFYWMYDETSNT